jgi:hypothetical protein
MGRIGNFFKKIGKGIKKAAVWTSQNVIRPVVHHINNNSVVGAVLDHLGPVGSGIKTAARLAGKAYSVYDNKQQIKDASSGGGIKGVVGGVSKVAELASNG